MIKYLKNKVINKFMNERGYIDARIVLVLIILLILYLLWKAGKLGI